MGTLLSCFSRENIDTDIEVENDIQQMSIEIKELEKKVRDESEKYVTLKSVNKKLIRENNRLKHMDETYTMLLHKEAEKTADALMDTDLHLDYMDDATEKKHIVGVLNKVYEFATI